MAYHSTVSPTYNAAYSTIPLEVFDTRASASTAYNYLINVLCNTLTVSSELAVQSSGLMATKLTFIQPHSFVLGDMVFLNDTTTSYSGYYNVMSVPSTLSIVIDLPLSEAMIGAVLVSNVLPFKQPPLQSGRARLDLGNTLKNFVTQNLEDTNDIFAGPDTKLAYSIKCGAEYQENFNFYDNIAGLVYTSNVGFINTGLTATSQTKFQVGDDIIIRQNLFEVPYSSVTATSDGYLRINTNTDYSTSFNRLSSFNVDITGQNTYPDGNGPTTTTGATGNRVYTLKKTAITPGTTVVDGGVMFAALSPEYSRVATIIAISLKNTGSPQGVILETDITPPFNTPAIGGTISSANGSKVTVWDGDEIIAYAYNQFTAIQDFSTKGTALDYVFAALTDARGFATIQTRTPISGITNPSNWNRIEPTTKSWTLVHTNQYGVDGIRYKLYNASNTLLASCYIPNTITNKDDWYAPVGLNQIASSPNVINTTSTIAAQSATTEYYTVQGVNSVGTSGETVYGKTLVYQLNDDCSKYDIYHLMWKDAKGSWISYPFKYLSNTASEVSRSQYYQNNVGNWGDETFSYNTYSKGESTFYVKSRDKMVLNSGWITQAENHLIIDLLKSAAVYLQKPDGTLLAAQIKTNELPPANFKDDLVQYTIPVAYANDERRY
jgi:hypothetical protein